MEDLFSKKKGPFSMQGVPPWKRYIFYEWFIITEIIYSWKKKPPNNDPCIDERYLKMNT